VLASLIIRVGRRGVVPASALPPMFDGRSVPDSCRLDQARRAFDVNFVRAALVRCGGHRAQAASELGLTRQGLAKLMVRLGIDDRAL
jgi:transcriptional regulator with GAF, ATPase, and Fis domain